MKRRNTIGPVVKDRERGERGGSERERERECERERGRGGEKYLMSSSTFTYIPNKLNKFW